ADTKLRSGEPRTLDLEPTPKLLDSIRRAHPDLTMVGFKAETSGDDEAMVQEAAALRDRVDCAFVVANDASVMGRDETRALLVGPEADAPADCETVDGPKSLLADRIARRLASTLDASADAA
ncbi:MAG: phosphopantothenoylcysteine decarboxylase, partial [Halohasta sp.]